MKQEILELLEVYEPKTVSWLMNIPVHEIYDVLESSHLDSQD